MEQRKPKGNGREWDSEYKSKIWVGSTRWEMRLDRPGKMWKFFMDAVFMYHDHLWTIKDLRHM